MESRTSNARTGAKDVGEFSESFSARLQAMAASQDMLTRSRWQKADLGELLRIELSQAFGKELPDDMLSGPKVMLSETATQALGLTFHELATNALKYGEAGNSPEALQVEWALEGSGSLRLFWRETGSTAVSAPEKPGFGTRLIDMNITRELKGTIRRGRWLEEDERLSQSLASSENDAILVRSTIDLAHQLGLQVVAEGVEDRATLEMLRDLGCDYAQGYFIAKPIHSNELLELATRTAGDRRVA